MGLAQKIITIPNILTISRIALSPVIGCCLLRNMYEPAFILTMINGTTDFLDGWYARKFKMQSNLGKIIDPLADKIFVFSSVVPLIYNGFIPTYLGGVIVTRDLGLIIGSARYFKSARFNASNIRPTLLSKINTTIQISYILSLIASGAFHSLETLFSLGAIEAMKILVCTTSFCTAFQYLNIYGKIFSRCS